MYFYSIAYLLKNKFYSNLLQNFKPSFSANCPKTILHKIRFKYSFLVENNGDRELEIQRKALAYEFNGIVQNALDEGRTSLNDNEANHLLKISERLLREYIRELENSMED